MSETPLVEQWKKLLLPQHKDKSFVPANFCICLPENRVLFALFRPGNAFVVRFQGLLNLTTFPLRPSIQGNKIFTHFLLVSEILVALLSVSIIWLTFSPLHFKHLLNSHFQFQTSSFDQYKEAMKRLADVLSTEYKGKAIWKSTSAVHDQTATIMGSFRRFTTDQVKLIKTD